MIQTWIKNWQRPKPSSFLPPDLLPYRGHYGTWCSHQGLGEVHQLVMAPRTGTPALRVKDAKVVPVLVKPVYGNFSRYWLISAQFCMLLKGLRNQCFGGRGEWGVTV